MNNKYISLVAKYLSGDIEDKEREVLFGLVNSTEEHKLYFEEMQNLWTISGEEESDDMNVDTDIAWQKVATRIAPSNERPKTYESARVFKMGQLLKVAAVLIGVMGAVWWYSNRAQAPQLAFYETFAKEQKEVALPDGSTVWLNENSKLSFDKAFEPRRIELEGEAFFDVEHLDEHHKFEIRSGDMKTTVLGTTFNVRAYPEEDQVEVTVETGKVVFENEKVKTSEKKVVLTAGESGIYKKKEVAVVKPEATISNANAWKTQQLQFDDAKISEVIDVMERYFDIKIYTENSKILNCPLNGTYPNPKVDELVEVLKFSLDIEIDQNENTLTFSGEGCE